MCKNISHSHHDGDCACHHEHNESAHVSGSHGHEVASACESGCRCHDETTVKVSCGCCEDDDDHSHSALLRMGISFVLMLVGLFINHIAPTFWLTPWGGTSWLTPQLLFFIVAFLPVGFPIWHKAWNESRKGDVFNEFLLMTLASVGAFVIGEYPEAVGVMVFYAIGEYLQDRAVDKANDDIRSLVDLRPDKATVLRNGQREEVSPDVVAVGEIIEVPAGGRVPLDAELMEGIADFDTAALTGESEPRAFVAGEVVSAGMIVTGGSVQLKVVRPAAESALSRILKHVKEAYDRKSYSEKFIRRFARIYTPVVTIIALLLAIFPPLLISGATFNDYLYRSCVFLVVSCPCALVISIPLGYYSGIGVGSSKGILFKGSNYIDALTEVKTVVFDKTGTLTTGKFSVEKIIPVASFTADELLRFAAALEQYSTHPVGRAVLSAYDQVLPSVKDMEETAGKGLAGIVEGHRVALGNAAMLTQYQITPDTPLEAAHTAIYIVIDGKYAGVIALADRLKADAVQAIERLHQLGVKHIALFSGDRTPIVENIARQLGVDEYAGDLLPEDKLKRLAALQQKYHGKTAFVGDGINDAPALALADVGIAMGAAGSDVAIETADMVIQTDKPSRVADAVSVGRLTRKVVRANIILALGIKAVILTLGAFGIANLWLAVLADTGVALWCVANTFLIQLWARKSSAASLPR